MKQRHPSHDGVGELSHPLVGLTLVDGSQQRRFFWDDIICDIPIAILDSRGLISTKIQ